MRLIDADALKKKLQARHNNSEEDFDRGFDLGIGVAMNLIHNAPTRATNRIRYRWQPYRLFMSGGQVVPDTLHGWRYEERPQGEWLHPYATKIACECSNCHLQLPITDYFNFCPNCGAYMRKGDEN